MPRSDIEEAHEAYYIYCRENGCDTIKALTRSSKYIGERFNTTRVTTGTSYLEILYQDSIAQSKYEEDRQRRDKGSGKTKDRDMRDPFADLDDMWNALPQGRDRFERDSLRRSAKEHRKPHHNPFLPSTYKNRACNGKCTPPHKHSSAYRTGSHGYNTETRAPFDAGSSSSRREEKNAKSSPKFQTEFREPRGGAGFERKHHDSRNFYKMPHGEFPKYMRLYSASPPPMSPLRGATHVKSSKNGGSCYTTEERNPFSSSTGYFPYISSSSYTPYSSHYHYFPETSFFPPKPHFSRRPRTPPPHSYFPSSRPRTPPPHFTSNSHSNPYDSHFNSHSSARPPPPGAIKPPTALYTVLNIACTATASEIKKAHRVMSLKWHPDRCKDEDKDKATVMMAEINQANDVLGDEKKRAFYDRWGVLPSELG